MGKDSESSDGNMGNTGYGGSPCRVNDCPGCSKCSSDDKCFPYSALIDTPYGKIQIGDLSAGQMVWSFRDGVMVKRPITKKLDKGMSRIMEITFGEGESKIRCAPVHSFLTNMSYVALPDLAVGDSIVHVTQHGENLRRITSIVDTGKVEPVFNLYTQCEHNFIVDGYVAHNFTRFRTLRTIFHRLFLDGQVNVAGSPALQ